jgi:hypothetical protein
MRATQQGRSVLVSGTGVGISGASSAIAVGGPIQAVSLDDIRRLVEVDGVGQVAGVAAQDAP